MKEENEGLKIVTLGDASGHVDAAVSRADKISTETHRVGLDFAMRMVLNCISTAA